MRNDRIDPFVSNPDAGVITGARRMGTVSLLDTVADRIAESDSDNVIRIKEKDDVLDRIRSETVTDKKNHIFLYVDIDPAETDIIAAEFPDAQVYRSKELCHQVPACFKENVRADR